ncbi:MAG: hypothetical protein JO128_14395 [Alphaproteobacteria bacterium]|nr:hypothetical protein [Alphaproteobacteria bacterium]
MQPYRCYVLDGTNHVVRVEDRHWPDDTIAAVWAESIREHPEDIYATELWCRTRLVRRREASAP